MKSILFLHSHTLYAKATIPVALACLERGWRIYFAINRLNFFGKSFGFSDDVIKHNPTAVDVLNPDAFDFVSTLIGLQEEWRNAITNIHFSRFGVLFPKLFDVIVGTQKDIEKLSELATSGTPTFALGYEHLPVLVRLDNNLSNNSDTRQSVFFSDNPFSFRHGFSDIIKNYDCRLNGFTYLDHVHKRRPISINTKDRVLIFHPGGYRNIVSSPGDNKERCYASQKALLERLCLPLIKERLTPFVKVHPLRAQYHDFGDLELISREIEKQHGLPHQSIKLLGSKELFWDTAFRSAFVLTFGSTAMYELWSVGLKNIHVCNFEGTTRSDNFGFFPSVFLNSLTEYLDLVSNPEQYTPTLDPLASRVYTTYSSLFKGTATLAVVQSLESA